MSNRGWEALRDTVLPALHSLHTHAQTSCLGKGRVPEMVELCDSSHGPVTTPHTCSLVVSFADVTVGRSGCGCKLTAGKNTWAHCSLCYKFHLFMPADWESEMGVSEWFVCVTPPALGWPWAKPWQRDYVTTWVGWINVWSTGEQALASTGGTDGEERAEKHSILSVCVLL